MRRVLIAGGGFGGVYVALRLERKARRSEFAVTLVSPESFMTYQPFLPEAAAGTLEPRHVAIPLRTVLKRTDIVTGRLASLDHAGKTATIRPDRGKDLEIAYDDVVIAVGSVSRVLPIPGLEDFAVGFKSIAEAIHLRNHVVSCMDVAESTAEPDVRRRALTFVFVGGGYAGAEALAELEDLARDASKRYRRVARGDMRWVLVEAQPTILSEMSGDAGAYAVEILRERGIEVALGTTVESVEGGRVRLSNGDAFEADTVVWTAGVKANPVVSQLGLPVDERGSLVADEYLRVSGAVGAWTLGDCALPPEIISGRPSPPTAQHAVRQARRLADNLTALARGRELGPFRYRYIGSVASLGRYKGVATVFGLRFRGVIAWFMHRTYHLRAVPTFNRRVRIAIDWTIALFFGRDIVQLGSLQRPREVFRRSFEAGSDGSGSKD